MNLCYFLWLQEEKLLNENLVEESEKQLKRSVRQLSANPVERRKKQQRKDEDKP